MRSSRIWDSCRTRIVITGGETFRVCGLLVPQFAETWTTRNSRLNQSKWRQQCHWNFRTANLCLTTLKFDSSLVPDKLSAITMPTSKELQTSDRICPLCKVRRPRAGRKYCTPCREIECERLIEKSRLEEDQALKSIEVMCDPR